jgi:4-amino-4-deoxy-L-arabinose transferase-like glycosyltransferase
VKPALAALAAATALRLAVAAWAPLAPDEAYYWVWSRALAPGFLDHPPMVALFIRAGTALAGPGALGVRLLAPLAAALGSVLLAQAGTDLLRDRRAGLWAAAMLNATPLLGIGAATMTPDTPLLLFWTATLWALARLLTTGKGAWWLVAGAAGGLALDSKYSAALLAPAILFWLLTSPGMRPWLRRPHPWLAAALALALFAPVLWWNARHGWASFGLQGGRVAEWEPGRAGQFLAELVGSQLGLASPLLAILFVAGVGRALRGACRSETAALLLAALTVLPALVFVQHALGDRVQGNWPAVIYPAAAIAAAGLWSRWRHAAVALGVAMTAAIYTQAVFALAPLPTRLDPTLTRLGGWAGLADQTAAAAHAGGAAFVAADNYGEAAELARLLPPDLPVIGVEWRWGVFDLPDARPAIAGRTGLLLRDDRYGPTPDLSDWAEVVPLGQVARVRDGIVAERYRLYRVTGRAGLEPAVMMPRQH